MRILIRKAHPDFAFSDDRSSIPRSNSKAAFIAARCHTHRFWVKRHNIMPTVRFAPATSQESPSTNVDDASGDSGSSGSSTPAREAPPLPERPAFLTQMRQGASAAPRASLLEQALKFAQGNVTTTSLALDTAKAAYDLALANRQLTPGHERALTSARLGHDKASERLRKLMAQKTQEDAATNTTRSREQAFLQHVDAQLQAFTAQQSTARPSTARQPVQATGPHATPSGIPPLGNRPMPAQLTPGPAGHGIAAGPRGELPPQQQSAMVDRIRHASRWDEMDSLELCLGMNDLGEMLGLGPSVGLRLQTVLSSRDIPLETRHRSVDNVQAQLNAAIVRQFDSHHHRELLHTVASLSDELRLGADGALDNMEEFAPQRITRTRL